MEKKFWIDFAEGRISVDEMLCKIKENKKLVEWFGKIVQRSDRRLRPALVARRGEKNHGR